MRLHVIPGHGAGDSGAVGYGYQEQERVRALASRMKDFGGDSVVLYDFNRNFYADKGINSMNVPKGDALIELHLDSSDSPSAHGGHVIIKEGFSPDAYDKNLAAFISGMFPGRSQTIVGRSNLGNVNRAAARGINYRLLECCFISNEGDITKFNANIDEVAKGILAAFGIGVASDVTPAPTPTPNPEPTPSPSPSPTPPSQGNGGNDDVRNVQRWLNQSYGVGIAEDGIYGKNTKRALTIALQTELNRQFGAGLAVDGIFGKNTKAACVNVKRSARGNLTKTLQGILICLGYNTNGFDGIFGGGTESAVRSFQSRSGISSDGVAGKNTWEKLLG